jgi:hypothetical protein
MSDPGRKNLHTKLKDKVTPGIFKSRARKAKEKTTDQADTVARYVHLVGSAMSLLTRCAAKRSPTRPKEVFNQLQTRSAELRTESSMAQACLSRSPSALSSCTLADSPAGQRARTSSAERKPESFPNTIRRGKFSQDKPQGHQMIFAGCDDLVASIDGSVREGVRETRERSYP